MPPSPEDLRLSLDYLRSWRDRFQKTYEKTGTDGSRLWVEILNSLLDDPVQCEAWCRLPDARAQAAALARYGVKVLRRVLREGGIHR